MKNNKQDAQSSTKLEPILNEGNYKDALLASLNSQVEF